MLGLDKALGDKITAAIRDCTTHVLPPKEAKPLLFSSRIVVYQSISAAASEYTCTAGVHWNPRSSSAILDTTNAHQFSQAPAATGVQTFIDTDLTQNGEPFFNGRQGIVWPYAVVGLYQSAATDNLGWSAPNVQGRITWELNGQALPGYLRQFVGGNVEGNFFVLLGANYYNTQSYSTGPLPLAPVPGITLQSGDELRFRLDWPQIANATAECAWQFYVIVRGWMW